MSEQSETQRSSAGTHLSGNVGSLINSLFANSGIATPAFGLTRRGSHQIRTEQDLNDREYEAFNEQHEGNYRAAITKYEALLADLDEAISALSPDDSDNTRELFILKRQVLQDRVLALRLAIGTTLDGEDNETTASPILNTEELESAMGSYTTNSRCNLIIHTISLATAALGLYASVAPHTDCNIFLLEVAIWTYLPIGVTYVIYATLQRWRLKQIEYNPLSLDRTTHRLWPKGSDFDKMEMSMRFVFMMKTMWFIFGVILLFGNSIDEECRSERDPDSGFNYFSLFMVILMVSCIDMWINMVICALLPLFCVLLSYFLIREYRNYLKTKPVGMKQKELRKLSNIKFKPGVVDEEHATCIICLLDFENNQNIRKLPCSGQHAFHQACIDTWLLKNDTCPQCREHIRATNKKRKRGDSETPVEITVVSNTQQRTTNQDNLESSSDML